MGMKKAIQGGTKPIVKGTRTSIAQGMARGGKAFNRGTPSLTNVRPSKRK